MATQADVRRIALALPDVEESKGRFAFSVLNKGKAKGLAWVWLERRSPQGPRVPNPKVLAVRVANLGQKELLLAADPVKFFTEPHYNGYPAVLVHLAKIRVPELRLLIEDAWRCQAPKAPRTPKALKAPKATSVRDQVKVPSRGPRAPRAT